MLSLLVFSYVFAAAFAQEVKDCAGGNSLITIDQFVISPHPIELPSNSSLKLEVNLNDIIENVHLQMKISKRVLGIPIELPCMDGLLGSCTYNNVCDLLDIVFPAACPTDDQGREIPCKCPFQPAKLFIERVVQLPELPPELAALASGRYDIEVRLLDAATNGVVSCAKLDIRIA